MAPCSRQGPYWDTSAGPAAASATPERWSTDHGKGTTAGLKSGQTTARRQHPIILTVSK
jgi:hypothetical protein